MHLIQFDEVLSITEITIGLDSKSIAAAHLTTSEPPALLAYQNY